MENDVMRNLDDQALHAMFRPDDCEHCDNSCLCHEYERVSCQECHRDELEGVFDDS